MISITRTTVARLVRVSWATVARAVVRVVADQLDASRLDELFRIGIDEVSWRKGHRYLTVVADHDRDGAVVWAGEGRSVAIVERFFTELGPERTAALEAMSCDMSAGYLKAVAEHAPDGPGGDRPVPRRQARERGDRCLPAPCMERCPAPG